ncbi:hypothetical protein CLAIMM_10348 isoform 2 [Cladophialophora immunda]|nr:hypothetical protein CLAIMM_10348 isoform 1 [Cladophialophora immunda]OQV05647.1 hypothetical protein CLAIMM_10348 isoform 2 [Cladophialophora immunda]
MVLSERHQARQAFRQRWRVLRVYIRRISLRCLLTFNLLLSISPVAFGTTSSANMKFLQVTSLLTLLAASASALPTAPAIDALKARTAALMGAAKRETDIYHATIKRSPETDIYHATAKRSPETDIYHATIKRSPEPETDIYHATIKRSPETDIYHATAKRSPETDIYHATIKR